ncbi:MAG: aminoglycoside phosphotransferase family protein [Bdellovibrionota bacterium]
MNHSAQSSQELSASLRLEIEAELKSIFKTNAEFQWENLPGDASNRRYVRVRHQDETRILMIMNAPEAFKSEEKTQNLQSENSEELDYVRVTKAWQSHGIRVPRIDAIGSANDFLILEDFGQELLFDRRQNQAAIEFYKKSIEELIKIQRLPLEFPFKKSAFTEELFRWELHHFFEYAIEKRDVKLSSSEAALLHQSFDRWAKYLGGLPQVVSHRDYHSKNLMILKDRDGTEEIGVIDFQDALSGPIVYDLASLLRDSYVRLSDQEEAELFAFFSERAERMFSYEDFCLQSIQRNLKAVGRFFYISIVKKRDTHLPYVKPSMARIVKSLEQIDEIPLMQLLQAKLGDLF